MKNKKGFTLTELIVALGIIGTIAALSVPSILNNINKRILASQIKNIAASIQQLATDQMVQYHTKNLADTDFGTASTLLTNSNFEIASTCSEDNPCWADSYKKISVSDNGKTYPVAFEEYGAVDSDVVSVKLKNGAVVGYSIALTTDYAPDGSWGLFYVDSNGLEEPNIAGRDFFAFHVTETGKLVGTEDKGCHNPLYDSVEGAGLLCFTSLVNNNWKMPDNDSDY